MSRLKDGARVIKHPLGDGGPNSINAAMNIVMQQACLSLVTALSSHELVSGHRTDCIRPLVRRLSDSWKVTLPFELFTFIYCMVVPRHKPSEPKSKLVVPHGLGLHGTCR